MTDAAALALPNAVDIHVASEEGLALLSAESGNVLLIDGILTVKVNTDKNQPKILVAGDRYRVGGRLIKGGDVALPNAVFNGYGMGPEDHVAIFTGKDGAPE